MKKNFFILANLLIFSCTNSKIHFLEQLENSQLENHKIHIQSLKVNFKERRLLPLFKNNSDEYLSKEEIDKIILEEINNTLKEDGFLAAKNDENIFEVDASIDLDRIYLIFSANAYIGTLHKGHKIDFYKDKEIIAHKNDSSRHFAKLGFKEGSKKFGKNIILSYDKEDERKEVICFAKYFAKELEKLSD